jgi:two-component system CheB/CheR fusion protein
VSILQGTLQFLDPLASRGLRHTIDFFFRALAENMRERAIGVIFSRTDTEGAIILRAIKGVGGLVIA